MTKKDLIDAVAAKTEASKKDVGAIIDAALQEIVATVANGEAVQLMGFGTFEPRKRNEKNGINPKTQEKITVPATTVPAFKAGKAFKDAVK